VDDMTGAACTSVLFCAHERVLGEQAGVCSWIQLSTASKFGGAAARAAEGHFLSSQVGRRGPGGCSSSAFPVRVAKRAARPEAGEGRVASSFSPAGHLRCTVDGVGAAQRPFFLRAGFPDTI
jgi:hypothetical protein